MSLESFSKKFFALEYVHGLIVRRHGETLLEQYRAPCGPADRHQMFSLSKSFTSTAFGIARGEGLVSLDDKVVSFFPEFDSERVSERMRRVTLRNLLTMSSGHASCALFGENYARLRNGRHFDNDLPLVRNILESELAFEPGSRFAYNTGATYLVSAVLQKVTGMRVSEYLRPRFFDPIGIGRDVVWDRTDDGIDQGGWGLNLTVREIAAAADVWLLGGVTRDGRRLIPEDYMKLASSRQISNGDPAQPSDWSQGYGFQFWMSRRGMFRGDGAAGQLAVMIPEYDAIVACTAGLADMQKQLNVISDELIPALEAGEPAPVSPPDPVFPWFAEPAAERDPSFAKPVCFAVNGADESGLERIALRPENGGLALDLSFADGTADTFRGGYAEPLRGVTSHAAKLHVFETYGRARWIAPGKVEFHAVVPCTTCRFTFELDLSAKTLRWKTPILFARDWLADKTFELFQCNERADR